ncbi:MAG: acetyl-coenzyme A synthetase [Sulfobacillus benefaciens]|uniref:acetate--CoA ligase n=1 Tax=Sulfobacillus benefaciens TaxID=453960 RepID=A0A2T2XCY5_9FIRM|nr:MAG: acetyl-coenzyme A synthetase [Sulfobacillus benefaciens]
MEMPEVSPMIAQSHLEPPRFTPSDRLSLHSVQDYDAAYRFSIEHLGAYWAQVARELEWDTPWHTDMAGSLPHFQFFVGGRGNVSVNCIDRHARQHSERTALIWIGEDGQERRWSYAALQSETAQFAQVLKDFGVEPGDVVALYLPNLLETFAAVHACYRIGAIYNIIFSGFSPTALYDRLADTHPKVVITADYAIRRGKKLPLKAQLDSILPQVPSIQRVIVVRRTGDPVPMVDVRDMYWDEALAQASGLADPVMLDANAPGFLIYTSGTTNKPKGLIHAGLGFLVAAYHNVKYALDLGPEDIYWCTADTGWLTFPIFELVGALAHGVTALVYEGALDFPQPDRTYQILEQYHVTKMFTAPTLLRMLARYGSTWRDPHDLSALRLVSLVGEPLDATTWQWVQDVIGHGRLEINNTYGQSETGSAWTSSVVGITPSKPGSCGMPLPGHAYQILDAQGTPVAPGQEGFLVLTQPFPGLTRGIWGNPERYESQYFSTFPGKYNTFDAAVEDADGHIWVLGRVDDVINVSGHRLSTMEMESALLLSPDVSEAAVVGIPDPVRGQVPVAFVTLANAASPEWRQQLSERVVKEIGTLARPDKIFALDAMPKTRSGKIVRRLLQELVMTDRPTGDVTGLEDPEVLPRIVEQVRQQS